MIHEIILLCLSGALIAFLQVSGTHSFPHPLSAEEEKSLFHAMRDDGGDARNTLNSSVTQAPKSSRACTMNPGFA